MRSATGSRGWGCAVASAVLSGTALSAYPASMDAAHARSHLQQVAADLPRRGEVTLVQQGPRLVLTLDAPAARNAVSVHMMLDLADAVDRVMEGSSATLLLRAASGPAFCAGGNLKEVRQTLTEPTSGEAMAVLMTHTLDRLLAAPVVSVAVVDGPAVGGGAELCTAVDHRVLGPRAAVHFAQGSLGVATGWGGARRLMAHVGRGPALRWLTTSARYSAEQCAGVGFGAVAVDALEHAERWLTEVERSPVASIRALKRQVASASFEEATAAFLEVWGGPDHLASLARPPR